VSSQKPLDPNSKPQELDLAGVEAAMRRAAEVARHRAINTSGSVAIYRNGKIVHEKDAADKSTR